MSGLELDGLVKRYETTAALDGLSLQVEPGRLTGFLGPNGAGKTTAMRCVFGLVRPDAGTVRWKGSPVDPAARRRFGYMPEERGLYPRMRVGDEVAYFGRLAGLDRAEAALAANRWLERLGLTDRARDRVEALSHGNQQRVQLAVALAHDPDVLVLDEPFAGLDPLAIDSLGALMRERAEGGAAVLFSSHQLDLVEHLCDDVAIVDHGRVVLAGALEDLRSAARTRSVHLAFDRPVHWTPLVDGVRIVAAEERQVRLSAPPGADLEAIVRDARRAGAVTRFAWEPPTLTELFRDAVAATSGAPQAHEARPA